MRTLRELAGWALLMSAWLLPVAVLVALVAWLEGDLPVGGVLLALLVGSAWPRLILSARRLREPDPIDVAEADGRRSVLLLHGFTPTRRALATRLFAFQPDLFRDWLDHLTERALARSLGAYGPLVPLARPLPPPSQGPVRPNRDAAWRRALERRLRAAGRVAIVVDESEACLHELVRAIELVGLSRVILVFPRQATDAFRERWSELRSLVPGLPEHDRSMVAVRFGADARPHVIATPIPGWWPRHRALRSSDAMLGRGRRRAAPKPPSVAWLLPFIPAAAGLFSAATTPLWLDLHGVRLYGDDTLGWGFSVFVLGVTLAVLARRAVRIVPSNEAVMVFVAALPWLVPELVLWLEGSARPTSGMKATAAGAAYAAPLLLGVGLALAGGALVRRSPGRSIIYGAFGAAALVPLATLGVSLERAGASVAFFVFVCSLGAGIMALVAAAASGSAGRPHAPLPLGAAAATALGVAAWSAVLSHGRWAQVGRALDEMRDPSAMAEHVAPLATFGRAWPWFVWVAPAVVALIALQFRGRASRLSIGNVAALAPLVLLVALSSGRDAQARASFEARRAGLSLETIRSVVGPERAGSLTLATLRDGEQRTGPVDVVIDEAGAHAAGRLAAVPVQLVQRGRGTIALQRALTEAPARQGRTPRIAVGARAAGPSIVGAARVALAQGGDRADLVFRGSNGGVSTVPIVPRLHYVDPSHQSLYVIVRPTEITLQWDDTPVGSVPDIGGRVDRAGLTSALHVQRQVKPDQRGAIVVAGHGADGNRLADALSVTWSGGYEISLEDSVSERAGRR